MKICEENNYVSVDSDMISTFKVHIFKKELETSKTFIQHFTKFCCQKIELV